MKEKLKVSDQKQKLQILTLTPDSWSVRKAAECFKVSKSTIQQAKLLKAEKGIVGYPDMKKRQKLSQVVLDTIYEIYCDDEFSRQLPGKKDYISISRNVHVSKRLLLCNLKELFAAYKVKYPEHKVGFSTFASLRPKWCILVGPKGTHSVCICTIHQNLKLMLSAIGLENSYHSLIDMIVCNRVSKICMIHRCTHCPGTHSVRQFLYDHLIYEKECNEADEQMEIDFKQWTKVGRADLASMKLPVYEFIELLIEKLSKITVHSFIARAQSDYLKILKETLGPSEVIMLGDFAENYSFVIQDEVQGYHWNKSQCSLHPVVLYHCSENTLVTTSLCILSDDLDHDASFVYKVMEAIVGHVKVELVSNFKTIHYFSDGCAGQYKNRKHFYNLCFHASDFAVNCEWNFFATSHGKSPCDGIGGTVKRLTARASLQRTSSGHILTAEEMFTFCESSIPGVKFIYIPAVEINTTRNSLQDRFSIARTIPGTRTYHQFIPTSTSTIKMRCLSNDDGFELEFDFLRDKVSMSCMKVKDVRVAQFILCKYDDHHWVGMVSEVNEEEHDVKIKFMHPNYPSVSYKWPISDDVCWVPETHLITRLETPLTSSVSARQYYLAKKDVDIIESLLN